MMLCGLYYILRNNKSARDHALIHRTINISAYPTEVLINIRITNSDHTYMQRLQLFCPLFVSHNLLWLVMFPTIEFHC